MKHAYEDKLKKCSDVAGKLFQEMTIRSKKNMFSYTNYNYYAS